MNKYLIQWEEFTCEDECHYTINKVTVLNATDQKLEDFCKDKNKVKVTFLCKVEKSKPDFY